MCNKQRILENELNHLRDELLNLKKCQITFFTLSISATALLLSIAFKFDKSSAQATIHHIQILIFLSPLLILIPCWWIIFDKASTITRIVGYYRIIESVLINNTVAPLRYIGWENALREFRKKQKKIDISDYIVPNNERSIIELFFSHRTAHTFWVIIWWSYFILSLLCIIISYLYLISIENYSNVKADIIVILVGVIVFCWSAVVTSKMVWRLVYGRNSYDVNEKIWLELLKK